MLKRKRNQKLLSTNTISKFTAIDLITVTSLLSQLNTLQERHQFLYNGCQ